MSASRILKVAFYVLMTVCGLLLVAEGLIAGDDTNGAFGLAALAYARVLGLELDMGSRS